MMTILITLVRKNFAVRHRPCCGFAVVFTTVVLAVFAVMEVDAGAATSSTSLATIDTPPAVAMFSAYATIHGL